MSFTNKNQGYALIIVLWTIVILSIILTSLVDEVSLNTMLVSNNLQQKRTDQVAVSGVMLGINQLKKDKTDYDTNNDQWTKVIEGELNNLKYKVRIKDIGSKFNINYNSYQLFYSFGWWNRELEKRLKQGLISDLVLMKDSFGKDYDQAEKFLTTYGKFNLNTDRLESLKQLMLSLQINEFQTGLVIDYLRKQRKQNNMFRNIDKLDKLYLKGLAASTVEKIEPYITTKGRININIARQELLSAILSQQLRVGLDSSHLYINKILNYRQENGIKNLNNLQRIMSVKKLEAIKPYFTVTSHYFLITTKIFSGSNNFKKEVKAIVKRKKKNNQWQVKILRWQE
ncbi:type II secretory pathway, component PulK [Halobacteroides halobius DSM 5150]|uniref:Type II secretory pathway, component PulK n=1 Tax=Halobacteroides halobius (strain ATCC 35273 / DSM 5150 / MD-1) TaxID=748449 RepID=L0KBK3_HALHC|nr:type II secretion system protein GspK [Halobacteroides halobius]AGB41468.1 type II secretory pathway, component PulK [Halobacteroides halobius DSM 5150]